MQFIICKEQVKNLSFQNLSQNLRILRGKQEPKIPQTHFFPEVAPILKLLSEYHAGKVQD